LKEASGEIAPSLTFIFQASIQQCVPPIDWKEANVVPLFKKGDRAVASNYRLVSLTCIWSNLVSMVSIFSTGHNTMLSTAVWSSCEISSAVFTVCNLYIWSGTPWDHFPLVLHYILPVLAYLSLLQLLVSHFQSPSYRWHSTFPWTYLVQPFSTMFFSKYHKSYK